MGPGRLLRGLYVRSLVYALFEPLAGSFKVSTPLWDIPTRLHPAPVVRRWLAFRVLSPRLGSGLAEVMPYPQVLVVVSTPPLYPQVG